VHSPTELRAAWLKVSPKGVPLAELRTDEAFQPRSAASLGPRDRSRADEDSANHVRVLVGRLKASVSRELAPVLVADIDGAFYVVDGHHRTRAYACAKRDRIPARVLKVSRADAVMVSKLVNFGAEMLPMHPRQAAEACWQFLAHISLRGRVEAPSTRSMEGQFGVSHSTVATMIRKIPTVTPADFAPTACDPGTGWPLWKHVRGNAYRLEDELTVEQRVFRRAEKLAQKIAGVLDKADPEALPLALDLLLADVTDPDRKEGLAKLKDYACADGLDDPF
jgi:hypothetical protein